MTEAASSPPIDLAREAPFRLAAADVRPATREVVCRGEATVLEPRVIQVLVALARRRGEVVSRDELIQACWRGQAVCDDAISRCIAVLRRLALSLGGVTIQTIARVGYRLDETPATPPAERAPCALLAVLPFESLSDEAELAHFSEGVSEEILQALARLSILKVIGRAASFQFRGPHKTVRHVAEQLHATHVVDGSVRRSGARVRITAHLIECESQTTLWSDRFDPDLTDAFDMQDAVAEAVAGALKQVLAPQTAAVGRAA